MYALSKGLQRNWAYQSVHNLLFALNRSASWCSKLNTMEAEEGRGGEGLVISGGWVTIVSKTAFLSQNNRHLDDSSIKPSNPYSEKFKK